MENFITNWLPICAIVLSLITFLYTFIKNHDYIQVTFPSSIIYSQNILPVINGAIQQGRYYGNAYHTRIEIFNSSKNQIGFYDLFLEVDNKRVSQITGNDHKFYIEPIPGGQFIVGAEKISIEGILEPRSVTKVGLAVPTDNQDISINHDSEFKVSVKFITPNILNAIPLIKRYPFKNYKYVEYRFKVGDIRTHQKNLSLEKPKVINV